MKQINRLIFLFLFSLILGLNSSAQDIKKLLELSREKIEVDTSIISKTANKSFAKKALNIPKEKKIRLGKLKSGTIGTRGELKKDLSNCWVIVNLQKGDSYFITLRGNIRLMRNKYFKVKKEDFSELCEGTILKKYTKKYVAVAVFWKNDYSPAYLAFWKKMDYMRYHNAMQMLKNMVIQPFMHLQALSQKQHNTHMESA
ncbi:MAG: hypothetical protein U9O87_00935 [Verrucomicrobiota bacterium]|nr:hypothetical protein [Verrucomicrobiota bacterium]